MLKDFKDFIIKGNAFDMAVGIILGGAFGLCVKSLVSNILMPLIGGLCKLPDFSQLHYAMDGKIYETVEAAQKAGPTVAHGIFINNTINLIIVGFALFVMVKYIEKATKKNEEEAPAPEPDKQEVLLGEIRDLLQK